MNKYTTRKQSTLSRLTTSVIGGRHGMLGLLPVPLMHIISGLPGIWDYILDFGFMGVSIIAVILIVLGFRRGGKGDDK